MVTIMEVHLPLPVLFGLSLFLCARACGPSRAGFLLLTLNGKIPSNPAGLLSDPMFMFMFGMSMVFFDEDEKFGAGMAAAWAATAAHRPGIPDLKCEPEGAPDGDGGDDVASMMLVDLRTLPKILWKRSMASRIPHTASENSQQQKHS